VWKQDNTVGTTEAIEGLEDFLPGCYGSLLQAAPNSSPLGGRSVSCRSCPSAIHILMYLTSIFHLQPQMIMSYATSLLFYVWVLCMEIGHWYFSVASKSPRWASIHGHVQNYYYGGSRSSFANTFVTDNQNYQSKIKIFRFQLCQKVCKT
jgi:hypothetical protein